MVVVVVVVVGGHQLDWFGGIGSMWPGSPPHTRKEGAGVGG